MYWLLVLNLIIPFVMIIVGDILKKHPVENMKSNNGYNTPTSRKSKAHWEYAQSIAPDIFINHGGLNSVYESIYLNKKQICIPMQEEQRFNALICRHKKIGGYVKKYTGLGKQLKEIEKWNKNSEKYSKIFKSYDGTKLAYEIIDKYIKEGF